VGRYGRIAEALAMESVLALSAHCQYYYYPRICPQTWLVYPWDTSKTGNLEINPCAIKFSDTVSALRFPESGATGGQLQVIGTQISNSEMLGLEGAHNCSPFVSA